MVSLVTMSPESSLYPGLWVQGLHQRRSDFQVSTYIRHVTGTGIIEYSHMTIDTFSMLAYPPKRAR